MKIRIAPVFKNQMAAEFNTSLQNIKTSLDYYNKSELAKKIRGRAKELLQKEANDVLDYYYDDAVCTAETVEEMNNLLKEKV